VINQLSYDAASIYNFIPASPDRIEGIKLLGEISLLALILGIYYVLIVRRVELTHARVVTLSVLFAILVPFLLPGMHERYFFVADVLSVALVFFRPRLWYVPLLVESASLLSYLPFLFHRQGAFVPMAVPSALMLAALISIGYQVMKDAIEGPAPISGADLAGTPILRPPGERPVSLPAHRV
jgi:hypothetical protein